MKKLFAILLAFTLLLALPAFGNSAAAESEPGEAPEPTAETWHGAVKGLPLRLVLAPDGAYTLTFAGQEQTGAWTEAGGEICLDGEDYASLLRLGGLLRMADGTFLYAEEPILGVYTPADVLTEGVTAETLNGYWKSYYVDVDGVPVRADDLGDDTDVYIQGERAALGGTVFGNVIVDAAFADGALTYQAEGFTVTMQLQADSLLRLTLSGAPVGDMVLFLLPQYVEGLSPAPEE